ncbi:hypothetical protein [Rathayibacter sp. AY1A3]|uniref:hypothetical protein n=1 Tax=Rathayibacter sp. AY1A3 TaxID=2080521 RepID=UPI000CE8B53F|nr:hypothetical protein [Rathayibacter sp. AY1A3]PPF34394.1 hypothetical protein C5C10_09335 [Rathayibacter sp. AY1A3]
MTAPSDDAPRAASETPPARGHGCLGLILLGLAFLVNAAAGMVGTWDPDFACIDGGGGTPDRWSLPTSVLCPDGTQLVSGGITFTTIALACAGTSLLAAGFALDRRRGPGRAALITAVVTAAGLLGLYAAHPIAIKARAEAQDTEARAHAAELYLDGISNAAARREAAEVANVLVTGVGLDTNAPSLIVFREVACRYGPQFLANGFLPIPAGAAAGTTQATVQEALLERGFERYTDAFGQQSFDAPEESAMRSAEFSESEDELYYSLTTKCLGVDQQPE